MSSVADEILMHYGMPRRSGRYPWGSGDDPYQRSMDFLTRVEELKKSGWKETPENIMEEFGLTTTQYRTEKSLAKDERRMGEVSSPPTATVLRRVVEEDYIVRRRDKHTLTLVCLCVFKVSYYYLLLYH